MGATASGQRPPRAWSTSPPGPGRPTRSWLAGS